MPRMVLSPSRNQLIPATFPQRLEIFLHGLKWLSVAKTGTVFQLPLGVANDDEKMSSAPQSPIAKEDAIDTNSQNNRAGSQGGWGDRLVQQ